MSCYLCGDRDYYIVPGKVRDNDSLFMKRCQSCGLVYISDKSHIIDGFYENSNMLSEDLKNNVSKWEKINKSDTSRRIKQFKKAWVAHPSYPDLMGFGRRRMDIEEKDYLKIINLL